MCFCWSEVVLYLWSESLIIQRLILAGTRIALFWIWIFTFYCICCSCAGIPLSSPELRWLDLVLSACSCTAMIRVFVLSFSPAFMSSHVWDYDSSQCQPPVIPSACVVPLGVLSCLYTSCSSSSSSSVFHSTSLSLIMSPTVSLFFLSLTKHTVPRSV